MNMRDNVKCIYIVIYMPHIGATRTLSLEYL